MEVTFTINKDTARKTLADFTRNVEPPVRPQKPVVDSKRATVRELLSCGKAQIGHVPGGPGQTIQLPNGKRHFFGA